MFAVLVPDLFDVLSFLPYQSLLDVPVLQSPNFANYVAGKNQQVVDVLIAALAKLAEHQAVDVSSILLWGETVGHTHLLHALHERAQEQKIRSVYLSLQQVTQPQLVCADLDQAYQLILLDDLEACLGDQAAEQALLHLFHGVRRQNKLLLWTAHASMQQCNFALTDLKTRIQSGLVWQLQPLDDQEQKQFIRTYIARYGLATQAAVADYLWTRLSRDLHDQVIILDDLIKKTLQHKQKITIRNVKKFLAL